MAPGGQRLPEEELEGFTKSAVVATAQPRGSLARLASHGEPLPPSVPGRRSTARWECGRYTDRTDIIIMIAEMHRAARDQTDDESTLSAAAAVKRIDGYIHCKV